MSRRVPLLLAALSVSCASGATGAGDPDAPPGVTADAAPPDAAHRGDSLPTGAISFFKKTSCPQGWIQYGPGEGRFLVPAAVPADSGKSQGTPLASGEDRPHTHMISSSITLNDVSYVGVAGGGNGGVAGAGMASFSATSDAVSTGLPYLQLFVCQKNAAPSAGTAPIPPGTLMFFKTACPDTWSPETLTAGRWLVGVPKTGLPNMTFGSTFLASSDRPKHAHSADGSIVTNSHGIALASGCCGSGYAANGTYTYSATSVAEPVDLPYLLLLQCRKN